MLLSGWGGAGAFSDGKLTLSTDVGGWLKDYCTEKELLKLINYVDKVYLSFGAPDAVYGVDEDKIEAISLKASLAGLRLVPQKLRHMGTEKCAETLRKMRQYLEEKVDVRLKTEIKGLIVKNNTVEGVETVDQEKILGKYVIVAPGRSGAEWLKFEAQTLGLKTLNNQVDISIRVEVLASMMEELTEVLFEPKLLYYSKFFDDQVRTF